MNVLHSSYFVVAATVGMSSLSNARAQDALSLQCSKRNLAAVYQNAYRRGQRAVDKAFSSKNVKGDCTQVDALHSALLDRLGQWIPQTSNGRDTPTCIAQGLSAGIYDGLAALAAQCVGVCIVDGAFAGELAGTLYCELSLRLGGLGLPTVLPHPLTSPCGDRFESACFEEYAATTQSYTDERGQACRPYLDGAFEVVWSSTAADQCAYFDDEEA